MVQTVISLGTYVRVFSVLSRVEQNGVRTCVGVCLVSLLFLHRNAFEHEGVESWLGLMMRARVCMCVRPVCVGAFYRGGGHFFFSP